MKLRPWIIGRLLLRFVAHCILSGLSTAWIILRGAPASPGFVRIPFGPMSRTGAAVLGALVTLTPGSSAIDIDYRRRELLLHFLDTRNTADSVAILRRDFERDLCLLFPEPEV